MIDDTNTSTRRRKQCRRAIGVTDFIGNTHQRLHRRSLTVMAPQVRPGLTQPDTGRGPQQSEKVMRRQPAYSIRARGHVSHREAECMAAISTCGSEPKNALGKKGASMYAGRDRVPFPSATRFWCISGFSLVSRLRTHRRFVVRPFANPRFSGDSASYNG
jgi:hypothetical protein